MDAIGGMRVARWRRLLPGRGLVRALTALLVAAGLLLGAYLHEYESAMENATRAVAQVGQSAAVRVSELLSRVDALSRIIASQTAGTVRPLAISATLIRLARLLPQANAVLLFGADGKLLGSSQFLVNANGGPSDDAWFKAAQAAVPGTVSLSYVTGAGAVPSNGHIVLTTRFSTRAGQPDRLVAVVIGRDAFRGLIVPEWSPPRVGVTIVGTAGDVLFAAPPTDRNASFAAIGSTSASTAATTNAAISPEEDRPGATDSTGTPPRAAEHRNPFGLFSSRPVSTTVSLPRDGLQVQASFSGILPLRGDASGLIQWSLWLCIGLTALAAVAALGRAPQMSRSTEEDLRERSRITAALQEAEASQQVLRDEIARAREDRDRILASVGHDVRTPMTSILGLTSLLQDANLQDEHRRWVGMIAASSQTLLAMLNGLLEIARGEEGEASLMIEDVDVAGLIGEVASVLDTQAREKGLDLITRVDDSLAGIWRTDATRVRQTLFNLVGNAIKYTSAGQVEIWARAGVETDQGRRIRLRVSDTGPGIPETDRAHIFEAFNRGSRATVTAGLGLGLAICRDNARLMGGTLSLESTVGVGTEFTFEFCAEHVQRPVRSQRFRGATAIIVGFTDTYRRQVTQYLDAAGFVVETAADGFIGLGLIERTVSALGSADLVITDGSMLGMPAEAFVRRLRATAFSAKARLIVVASSDNADSLRELPVEALIRAPGEPVDIAAAVDRVMTGWSPLQMLDPEAPPTPENRILVVEDDPVNRSLLKSLLSARGFSVVLANNGEEAVRISVRGKFQAILMDIQLPGIDGFEAARRIRAMNHAIRDVPILALTALTGSVVKRRSQEAGMTTVIEKPVNPHRLAQTVRKYIAQAGLDDMVLSSRSATAAEPHAGAPFSNDVSAAFLEAVVEELGELRASAALETFIADTNIRLGRLGELASAGDEGSMIRVCREVSERCGTFGAISLSEALDEVVAAVERQDRELVQRQVAEVERLTACLAPTLMHEFDAINAARASRRAA